MGKFMRGLGAGVAEGADQALKSELERDRDAALEKLRTDHDVGIAGLQHASAMELQGKQQTFQAGQQKGLLASEEKRSAGSAAARIQSAQILATSRERAASSRSDNAKQKHVNAPKLNPLGTPMYDTAGKPILSPHQVWSDPSGREHYVDPQDPNAQVGKDWKPTYDKSSVQSSSSSSKEPENPEDTTEAQNENAIVNGDN